METLVIANALLYQTTVKVLAAIHEAVNCLRSMMLSENHIHIFSNSQAALRALESVTVKSKTVENCRRSLNVLDK